MKIIDMHAHIWMWDVEATTERLIKTIETYGVSKTFVSTLSTAYPDSTMVEKMNNETHSLMKRYPQYIEGYVYVSPEHPNAPDVVKKGIEEQGMCGVKVWVSEKCDSEKMNPIAEKIIDYNVPVLIHALKKSQFAGVPTENTSEEIRRLALRYPELKIIMAHVDGNCYHGVPNVRDLKNVYVDISGRGNREGELEYMVENLGEDRVLFGTDLSEASFCAPYSTVVSAQLPDSVKQKILCDNTLRVFDTKFRPEAAK